MCAVQRSPTKPPWEISGMHRDMDLYTHHKGLSLISDTSNTIGGTFYCHDVVNDTSAVTAQHGGSIAQRHHAMEQLIVCDRHNSITAAYFDAPFAQGESQGAEKWQRLSFSLLRVVFETAEACKVSLGRAEANFFISCDYFSCVRKPFCAQGRHTA